MKNDFGYLRRGLARSASSAAGRGYSWMLLLGVLSSLLGARCLAPTRMQLRNGLVDDRHDRPGFSWGLYIANFAFLVGIAAAAVLLVIPAYVFNRNRDRARSVVI
jgi:Ni/Fe-hydrogenase subunit HybB-like protein